MENILKHANQNGLVIFAGAGFSMAPPSSLPGWNELNDTILETLWDRLEERRISIGFREKIIPTIKQRRKENKFPPDYQAQLMVERVGMTYFELLSAVDSNYYNPAHYYTALLAREGLINAVITTNFDKNFERAFEGLKVNYQSYFDEEGFTTFTERGNGDIAILKIHGCSSDPSSMVDTRKQRLKGRAKALENAISDLLHNHYFIFGGFSGQDFDDDDNYLGIKEAADKANGFTYLNFPGSTIRQSMLQLVKHYGKDKAETKEYDTAKFLEGMLSKAGIHFKSFDFYIGEITRFEERLTEKANAVEPMAAINILTALTESYGDEISARFLYDKIWKNRENKDYDGESFSRFLLNYGRSYVFSFQNRLERAATAGIEIFHFAGGKLPEGAPDYISNPAKQNLKHFRNTSPETVGLIALTQTYIGNPILFRGFPESLAENFHGQPTKTEIADIAYYYSLYAMIYEKNKKSIALLNFGILEMEADFDEPRISQLLSRRSLIKFRIDNEEIIESGQKDVSRARQLAEKYHEPNLLALSALALATGARIRGDYIAAQESIKEAINIYGDLYRIPQYIECNIEYLKILQLGLSLDSTEKQLLLSTVKEIRENAEKYILDRIMVFEPEYCYVMALIHNSYTDAPRVEIINWFKDAISFAKLYGQQDNLEYFRETCKQLGYLLDVEKTN